MEKLLIIDGNSLVNRAFYALPLLTNQNGEYSNAVYGFANILIKFITEHKPTHIAVAFDHAKKTFRNDIYAEYKGTRKGMPEELRSQMPILKDMLSTMNIKIYEQNGIEADDIIGTIAKSTDVETIILSGDRDVLQLIDSSTCVWITKKGITEVLEVNQDNMQEEFGYLPYQVVEMKSIMGDSSDNIPGVVGIGEVGAKNLISKYGTLDGIYDHIDDISGKLKEKLINGKEMAYLSHTLATIKTDCNIDFHLEDCDYDFPFNENVLRLFEKYEFKSLIKRQEIFNLDIFTAEKISKKNVIKVSNIHQLKNIINTEKIDFFAFDFINKIEFCFNTNSLYQISTEISLFDMQSFEIKDIIEVLLPIIKNKNISKITQDLKSHMHYLSSLSEIKGEIFDINLAKYLLFSGQKIAKENDVFNFYFEKQKLYSDLEKFGLINLYQNIELPLVFVLYQMENQGFKINQQALNEISLQYNSEKQFLLTKINEMAGEEFNVNSPKQLAYILFDKLGIDDKNNKKHSTNIEVLNEIIDKHEIIPYIIRYRKIQKLNSTYVEVYKNLVEKSGDIIYTIFNQTLTATGRLSSSEPNLQNIPIRDEEGKALRKLFISRYENGQIVSADYNQIELRLLANLSNDKNMIEGYKHNADIHRATASQIFGVKPEEVTTFQRSAAKAVNFGIVYGISSYGLSNQLGISPQQAKEFIDKYLQTYNQVMVYMNKNIEDAKNNGFSKTMFGRIRRINELSSSNKMIRMFGERVAMNAPLQGSASDIIKIAMIKVQNEINKQNLKSKLILQIHDELIVDAHPDEVETIKNILKTCMESVVSLEVPLVVSVESGKTWFDAH